MIFTFLFFGYFASRIHFEEDLNKMMPSSKNADGTTKLAFADLRIKDKTYLLFHGRKGMPADSIAAVADAFVDSLTAAAKRQNPKAPVVRDVFYQMPEDAMGDAIDYMMDHFPAYIDTAVYAHMDTLLIPEHFRRQMAQNAADMEGEFGSAYPELIQMDPMGMRTLLADQMKPLFAGSTGGYKTIDGHFFVPDSTVCVAFITPRFSATDTGQGNELFKLLNAEIEKFAVMHLTSLCLIMVLPQAVTTTPLPSSTTSRRRSLAPSSLSCSSFLSAFAIGTPCPSSSFPWPSEPSSAWP